MLLFYFVIIFIIIINFIFIIFYCLQDQVFFAFHINHLGTEGLFI